MRPLFVNWSYKKTNNNEMKIQSFWMNNELIDVEQIMSNPRHSWSQTKKKPTVLILASCYLMFLWTIGSEFQIFYLKESVYQIFIQTFCILWLFVCVYPKNVFFLILKPNTNNNGRNKQFQQTKYNIQSNKNPNHKKDS